MTAGDRETGRGAPLGWAVLGTGGIARKFAAGLVGDPGAGASGGPGGVLTAVGSRSAASAERFAGEFGGRPHGSYEAALADPSVAAVYISLPNALHHPWALRALAAGKHVLCEKPLACSAAEGEELFAAAAAARRVLVEAFMYRCHPAVEEVVRRVRTGELGEVKLIHTSFTYNRPADPDDIRYRPELAGGALMDVGCYCLHLARALAGEEPEEARVAARLHATGVDEYAAGLLRFPGGALATYSCGMTVFADRTATVAGTEGYIAVPDPWFSKGEFTLVRGTPREPGREVISCPAAGADGYAREAAAFSRVVAGEIPAWITPEDSLGNLRLLDELRGQIGEGG